MGDASPPVARSPIRPAPPVVQAHGWALSARHSTASLRLRDCTPLAKVLVRAPATGRAAEALGAGHRRAVRDSGGVLVAGTGPGEWLLLAAPGEAAAVARRYGQAPRTGGEAPRTGGEAPRTGRELVTVVDVTHGRALVRLRGRDAPGVLGKVCALDLGDAATPDGTVNRTHVAGIVGEVLRDDEAGERSYLLACERDAGQYLFDVLLDAGAEFGIDVEGFAAGSD